MALVAGKDTKLLVAEFDLTGFFRNLAIEDTLNHDDTTVFGKGAHQRLATLVEARITGEGFFEAASSGDKVDNVLKAALTNAQRIVTVAPDGFVAGKPVKQLVTRSQTYRPNLAITAAVKISWEAVSDEHGLGHGYSLADLVSRNGAFTGTAVDYGSAVTAGNSLGALGFLHVTANTRDGSTAVKIQSDTAGGFPSPTDVITFASVGASTVGSEFVAVAKGTALEQHWRATATIGGTTGNVTFHVGFARFHL